MSGVLHFVAKCGCSYAVCDYIRFHVILCNNVHFAFQGDEKLNMRREDCLEIIECLNHIHTVQQRSILTSHEHKKLIVDCVKTIHTHVLSELAELGRQRLERTDVINQSESVDNERGNNTGNK
jgi:hypothetical protein